MQENISWTWVTGIKSKLISVTTCISGNRYPKGGVKGSYKLIFSGGIRNSSYGGGASPMSNFQGRMGGTLVQKWRQVSDWSILDDVGTVLNLSDILANMKKQIQAEGPTFQSKGHLVRWDKYHSKTKVLQKKKKKKKKKKPTTLGSLPVWVTDYIGFWATEMSWNTSPPSSLCFVPLERKGQLQS